MKKIIIIGCPGSGKSTLARNLVEKLNYPILHLDKIYHIDNNTHISRQQLTSLVAQFAACNDNWVIDGNYISTIEQRIDLADTIIWLDIDVKTCLDNAIARTKLQRQDDMAAGFDNSIISQEFVQFIKNFYKTTRPQILQLMQKNNSRKQCIVLKNYKQIDKFLQSIK